MADEVEMIPVAGAEPPKANPLGRPSTIKLNPVARKPVPGAAPSSALKPGLKLPPKPGLAAGLKLPPKPGATVSALKPGLKLPTQTALKPGLKLPTQTALKPGVKLPPKPVIRKPGATVATAPLPKPVNPGATAAAAPLPKPVKPVAAAPVAVDAQGVGKLPTVSATTVERGGAAPDVSALPKPMEALKSVTQKLKGITQEIPQQAILHKTGIIAEGGASEAQKEAAKHKTARISLSDAMGVAPVKNEAAPMKTIRIKRPINIPGATTSLTPPVPPASAAPAAPAAPAEASAPAAPADAPAAPADAPAATLTQRKTLKIARPGGAAVRPGGKFGIKRPGTAATTVQKAAPAAAPADAAAPAGDAVADIPDIPNAVVPPMPVASASAPEGPAWVWTLSSIVQAAACVAIGMLAWYLYENAQLPTFCGGLGWGS